MPRRKGYDIAPNRREGGWVLESGTTTERYGTTVNARRAPVSEARSEGNSHVIIRKKDGGVVYFMRAA